MFIIVFPNSVLTNYTASNGTTGIGTLQGKSLKVSNLSNRGVSVQTRGTGITVYYIEAYRYAIIPNGDYQLVLDSTNMVSYLQPSAQVSVTSIDDALPYQEGELLAPTDSTIRNSTNSPVPTAGQYTVTTQALGNVSVTLPAGTAAGGYGTSGFTPNLNLTNAKRLVFLITLSAQSNLGVTGSGVNVDIYLKGSNDGTNFYYLNGNNTYGAKYLLGSDSFTNATWDSTIGPQMLGGYNYLNLEVYMKNAGSTSTSVPASATIGFTALISQ